MRDVGVTDFFVKGSVPHIYQQCKSTRVYNTGRRATYLMDSYKTLLEENHVVSLRTAVVGDDGNLVEFRLMPGWLESSIPRERSSTSKGFEWVSRDSCYLYRHARSIADETELMSRLACFEKGVRPMMFDGPPAFQLVWADSGDTVAIYLDGAPWAFIDEATHKGYSKGVIDSSAGNCWDQRLFEKLFPDK